LTDLGSNCFGDANIGPPVYFPFFRGLRVLGRDFLEKKKPTLIKGVWTLNDFPDIVHDMCGSGNAHIRSIYITTSWVLL
jgi:hypothetical protein